MAGAIDGRQIACGEFRVAIRRKVIDPTRMPQPENPLWALQRATACQLECRVAQAPSALWFVTLRYGSETMLDESYPSAETALIRATSLKETLVLKGWDSARS